MSYQVPAPPYAPPPAYGPYPPPGRPRRHVPLAAAAGLSLAGLLLGAAASTAVMFGAGDKNSSAPTTAAPVALSPEAAQEQTCGLLKSKYAGVAAAIDERNQHDKAAWSDPALLTSVNHLVTVGSELADQLEESLSPATPAQLKLAVTEYVAGLRAMTISERNHAPNVQLNGTGLLYNQVVDAPLRICGIPG